MGRTLTTARRRAGAASVSHEPGGSLEFGERDLTLLCVSSGLAVQARASRQGSLASPIGAAGGAAGG